MNDQPTHRQDLAPIARRASSIPSTGVALARAAGTRTSKSQSSLEATNLIRKCAALSLFVLLSVSSALAEGKPSFVESDATSAQPTTFVIHAGRARGAIDGVGVTARFAAPKGVAIDASGNIIVADSGNQTIRRIDPSGDVSTIAGLAMTSGFLDGTGSAARFHSPRSVAIGSDGNIYVADDTSIRKISPAGRVTTLTGNGTIGFRDGPVAEAKFVDITDIAFDPAGNLWVADAFSIRKITPDGVVSTVAGKQLESGWAEGPGSEARFSGNLKIATAADGRVFVADRGNYTVRAISPSGWVSTFAGVRGQRGCSDGIGTGVRFGGPSKIAVAPNGELIVADAGNNAIRRILLSRQVTTIAGVACGLGIGSADDLGALARFHSPESVAIDTEGNIVVADTLNHSVRRITPGGQVTTIAGNPGAEAGADRGVDGPRELASFNWPKGIGANADGDLFVTDRDGATIRKIAASGEVTTLAGSWGVTGSADGVGSAARFNLPMGIAIDATEDLLIADYGNSRIRKVSTSGAVTTVAGSSGPGSSDGPGSVARFRSPVGIAVDSTGNAYITDSGNHTVRKMTPEGVVTTLAGLSGSRGNSDGVGSAARFDYPSSIAIDPEGNLLVICGAVVRRVTQAGVVSTPPQFATPASYPGAWVERIAIAVDPSGSVWLADGWGRILVVSPGASEPALAGNGEYWGGSAEGTGGAARFRRIDGLAVDANGDICATDLLNELIYKGVPGIEGQLVIDDPAGFIGETHHLSFTGVADSYSWRVTRRPIGSTAQLSSATSSSPTFVPDVMERYEFQLTAMRGAARFIGYVTLNPPTIRSNGYPLFAETSGLSQIEFTRSGDLSATATADWSTVGDSATPGEDFSPASGTITFNPGEASKALVVEILDDNLSNELYEAFSIVFSNTTNAIGESVWVAIQDDDPVPQLAAGDTSVSEGDTGSATMSFEVTLSQPSALPVTFQVSTSAGSAVAGTDFVPLSPATITIPAGQVSANIVVGVVGDRIDENDETFVINLSGPTWATIADASGTGTIVDDDTATLSIPDVTLNEGDAGTTQVPFTVRLSTPSASTVTVDYATADVTATAGTDYVTASGWLSFSPGSTERTLFVAVIGDVADDPTESFVVNLSNPTNAALGDHQAIGTIVNDDTPELTATPASTSRINLAWTFAGTGQTGFRIERKLAPSGSWMQIAQVSASARSYASLSLTTCTAYVYRVRSYVGTTLGLYSNEAAATTTGCLTTPSDLVATPVSATRINLSWSYGGTGHTGFKIERRLASATTWTPIATLATPSVISYANTSGLTGCTGYVFRVRAYSGTSIYGPYSNEATATTTGCLATPSDLVATPASATRVDLSWNYGGTGHTGFKIERRLASATTWTPIATLATPSAVSYANTSGLTGCTGYVYRVRAHSGTSNYGPYSNEAAATTTGCLATPSSLVATPASATRVDLSWSYSGSGHSGFKIERRLASASTWSMIATLATPSATSYANTSGLTGCTGYIYRVRAYSGTSNYGPYSNEAAASTTGCLATPSSLVATPASATRVDISWSYPGTGHSGFKIERRLASASTWSMIATLATPSATSYANVSGLTGCTGYVYRVRAYAGTVSGAYSNEATATTPGCLVTPSGLTATGVSKTQINLNWSYGGTGHSGFNIERRIRGNATWALVARTTTPATITYASPGLVVCTEYEYRVRAYSGTTSNSPWSNETTGATIGCITAPTGLVATPQSATSVRLTWSYAGSGHTGFKIERRLATGTTWAQLAAATAPGTLTYTNTSLLACRGYVYRVRAYTSTTANSLFSNEASATTTCP